MLTRCIHPRTITADLLRCATTVCVLAVVFAGAFTGEAAYAATEDTDLVAGVSAADRELPADQRPDIEASAAALMNKNGTLLFGRNTSEPTSIASLTKIMTALVAVEYLQSSDQVIVTAEAACVGESSAGLIAGDTMTFDDALKALLTASGNDAAFAIAQTAGERILSAAGTQGDAHTCVQTFVDAMNTKATAIGLVNSYFTNPHGLDFDAWEQGQYSCARDVAVMLHTAMEHDLIRANIGFADTTISVMRAGVSIEVALSNTDVLLREYPGTCAAKTGYTLAAGPCVAAAVNRDGHEYYAVVLGSTSKPQRFVDAEALFDWGITHGTWLRTPLKDTDAATLTGAKRVAFVVSWFMEGWHTH